MADGREPYLVQVSSISTDGDGNPVLQKMWLNIYYITRICEARNSERLYRFGARWYAILTNGIAVWVDDDDCEKLITNINGSY